jgi:DNA-binding MarR family transcriptional regulator
MDSGIPLRPKHFWAAARPAGQSGQGRHDGPGPGGHPAGHAAAGRGAGHDPEAIARRLGITSTDLKCLFLLMQRPHTPRELATELRGTPSAVTSVIDRLASAGLARRNPSTTGRRQVLVTVIHERAQQAAELYEPLYSRMPEILSRYDDDQLATLLHFAAQTVSVFEQLTGP